MRTRHVGCVALGGGQHALVHVLGRRRLVVSEAVLDRVASFESPRAPEPAARGVEALRGADVLMDAALDE
ncbi:MAG: hypothetical protein KDK70_35690, partial [Myxococcales bacterium]|nr:hypothetical protein [Myxococcales bacterium]